jgi:CubicO group peptidase (beta-lactamase class C family)
MKLSIIVIASVLLAGSIAAGQGVNTLTPDQAAKVTQAVTAVMDATKVPSASVGIVRDGRIVYTAAFGKARLSPALPASPEMHYAIGSISKQFTAAAVMLLAQEGKLSIDDPVARWFPELTRAKDVTLRNLMSHTSGYRDYAPQDYTIPAWTKQTTAQAIVHEWATKPLDFEPGTEYQYSNTNFNIVGLIVEKASGQPFWAFLKSRVLDPLGLAHTIDLDAQHDLLEPTAYFRYALGPPRPAIVEAPGWYFADGEMAMPVGDLLTWDISVMNESLLQHASYAAMETPTKLKDGKAISYGLGLTVGTVNGHRVVSHGGEVGGFVAYNAVYPEDKFAVAVFTNEEASPAASAIGRRIANALVPGLEATSEDAGSVEPLVRRVLAALQKGEIDRALFTDDANFYFNTQGLEDFRASLSPLGEIKALRQTGTSLRGGLRYRGFAVEFANGTRVNLSTYWTDGGKIEQFLVEPAS